ncbi:hypothetical protein HOD96_00760 [Candidatus Falkowbacteria bacterium]|jgi:hypothetical protein|nr:hypothetical protein [Candidatus Falkowbacteria bacterium]MBT4433231.1 hypothetical protein [Candidatus Falkowbacteria bacterium]
MLNAEFKKFTLDILQDVFYISLVSFFIFIVIEIIRPRFVTAYVNMNALLIVVIVSGIIVVLKNNLNTKIDI